LIFTPNFIRIWKCFYDYRMYSQTWTNDHLQIATTCLLRPLFWGPVVYFYYISDIWTTTTSLQRLLFWGPKGGRCVLYSYQRKVIFQSIDLWKKFWGESVKTKQRLMDKQVSLVSISPTFYEQIFLYTSVLQSFSLLTVWLCNFCPKIICAKAARKMLAKLTPCEQLTNGLTLYCSTLGGESID